MIFILATVVLYRLIFTFQSIFFQKITSNLDKKFESFEEKKIVFGYKFSDFFRAVCLQLH